MIMYAIRLSHDNLIHVWMVITRLRRGRIYRRTLKSRALPSIPMAVSLGKEWLAKCTKALLKEVPHLCKAVRKPTRLGAGRERACAGVRCGACGAGRGVPRAARGICGPHLGTWCQAIRCGNMVRGGTGCGATLNSQREPRNLEVSVRQWISLVYTLAGELGAGGHLFGMPCGPPGIPWTMVAVEKTTVSVQKRSKATDTQSNKGLH